MARRNHVLDRAPDRQGLGQFSFSILCALLWCWGISYSVCPFVCLSVWLSVCLDPCCILSSWRINIIMFPLSPVHTSNNVEATLSNATSWTILSTMSNVASTLLPFLATMMPFMATMSNEISFFRQSRQKLNMFNLFRLCRKDEILQWYRSTLLLVWTGPYAPNSSRETVSFSGGHRQTYDWWLGGPRVNDGANLAVLSALRRKEQQ